MSETRLHGNFSDSQRFWEPYGTVRFPLSKNVVWQNHAFCWVPTKSNFMVNCKLRIHGKAWRNCFFFEKAAGFLRLNRCQVHGQPQQLRSFQVEHRELPLDGDQDTGVGHGVEWCRGSQVTGGRNEEMMRPCVWKRNPPRKMARKIGKLMKPQLGACYFQTNPYLFVLKSSVPVDPKEKGATKTMITLFMDNRYISVPYSCGKIILFMIFVCLPSGNLT